MGKKIVSSLGGAFLIACVVAIAIWFRNDQAVYEDRPFSVSWMEAWFVGLVVGSAVVFFVISIVSGLLAWTNWLFGRK
jgi:cytochrome bd-type quinol oxidase subunit 2